MHFDIKNSIKKLKSNVFRIFQMATLHIIRIYYTTPNI